MKWDLHLISMITIYFITLSVVWIHFLTFLLQPNSSFWKMSVYAVFEPSSLSFSSTLLQWSLVMFLQTLTECFLHGGVLPEATEAVQNDFNSCIEGCFWNIHMMWLTCQFFAFPKSILIFIYLPIFYHS